MPLEPEDIESGQFDPLAVENVGVTLAVELLERPICDVPPIKPFVGAGVYALYYTGAHQSYKKLQLFDRGRLKFPVYIGKAAGESAKQGFNPTTSSQRKLYDRICEHGKSIAAVENLEVADFKCRYLVLNDAYITLAESVMIRIFRPPWNGMSFGSKVVGKNRMGGNPALWDSLHPGRAGRPEGSREKAVEAERLIGSRIDELGKDLKDIALRRMFDRIKPFI